MAKGQVKRICIEDDATVEAVTAIQAEEHDATASATARSLIWDGIALWRQRWAEKQRQEEGGNG